MHTYIYREEINTPAKLKLSVKVSNEGNSRNTYRHIQRIFVKSICIYNYLYMWSSVVEKRIAKTDKL